MHLLARSLSDLQSLPLAATTHLSWQGQGVLQQWKARWNQQMKNVQEYLVWPPFCLVQITSETERDWFISILILHFRPNYPFIQQTFAEQLQVSGTGPKTGDVTVKKWILASALTEPRIWPGGRPSPVELPKFPCLGPTPKVSDARDWRRRWGLPA